MKKLLFIALIILVANVAQAQVNGFTLTESSFPTAHNLGNTFPLNVSFNWTPNTTSATVEITYDPTMVSYDASCAASLPACMSISNNGTKITVSMADLSSCTNTGAISFNVCFQFNCPDTCTGVIKSALFSGLLTDNIPTTQNASCTANGILNNNVTLNHFFHSFDQLAGEVTYRACFYNPDCFTIKNPSFTIALSPTFGTITSVYGNNYTYSLAGNVITPALTTFNQYANDCFYYVVQLPCDSGHGQTLTSNVTMLGENCGVSGSTISGPATASFLIPAVPVAISNVTVSMVASASSFSYTIINTGNTPLTLTATNYLPLVHLKNTPNSVLQNTSQAGLAGIITYYDCSTSPTGPFPLTGNGANDANAPATNTTKFDHQVTNLLPGQWVSLTMYYDLTSSCIGAAGNPPYQDSLAISFECEPKGGPLGGCVPCGAGGNANTIVVYNPLPNITCMANQFIQGCQNIGDTLNLCYEFRNSGDATLFDGLFNVQLPAWLEADISSIVYTGFSPDPTIVPASNIQFNLPNVPAGPETYKICFNAIVNDGAVGGSNGYWSTMTGENLPNQQLVCFTSFNVCAFAAIGIDKKVKGDLDGGFTYSGIGSPNSTVQYEITITNTGTIAVDSLVVVDRIPQPGNVTILGSPNSVVIPNDFNMVMLPAIPDINYTAEYTITQNICTGWPATGLPCNAGSWVASVEDGGVKFTFAPAYTLAPGANYTFIFETKIPDTATNGMVDCNTAGFIGKSKTGGYTINPVETNPVCITVYVDTCNFVCNPDFEDEQLVEPGGQGFFREEEVSCWQTTAEDRMIEVWGDGFQGVPAYSGNQFIELNANYVATLYQNFNVTAGSTVAISFAHRGRVGFTNQMSVSIEPFPIGSGTAVVLGTYSASTTVWTLNNVIHTFPNDGVTAYVLSFISLPVGGTEAGGNFLDDISVTCPSSICGIKYSDLDGDGVRDSGEPGLANWTFNLTGTQSASTTTDEEGNFCFTNLPVGTYTVEEVNQANWQQTEPASPGTYTVTPIAGQTIDTLLFGNKYLAPADSCGNTDATITQTAMGECCFQVDISNTYLSDYFTGISITSDQLTIANVTSENSWSTITYQSPTQIVFTKTPFVAGIPLDTLGYQQLGNLCFTGSGINNVSVSFIGNAPDFDTICTKILQIVGCSIPVDTSCASVYNLSAVCDAGNPLMKFKIKNNSNFTMRGITLYSQNPDVIPSPHFIPIADLLPGQSSLIDIETLLQVSNNANNACFFIAACDQNTQPGEQGQYPQNCCMDSILYCVDIPQCDPCDGLSITALASDPVSCCYDLSFDNNYNTAEIGYLEFIGIGGTQFAFLSGWSIIPPVGSSRIKIKAPGGGLSPGNYPDFASFCLTGTSIAPHIVMVKILDAAGVLLCTKTLSFDCELVLPSCANIINDSLYCAGNNIKYTFSVMNNAPFPLYQIDFRTPDESIVLDSTFMELNPPIAKGSSGGPYTVTILSADKNLDKFCMYLSGHNGIYDTELGLAATECCTDSLSVVCLPLINCISECDTTICCQFDNMIIPNGITPNRDGINDVFEILNSTCCDRIAITVFNRWGNVVYQNEDYQNDWKGVNESGTILVQGTYFILLELPTGNTKGIYIDIRY